MTRYIDANKFRDYLVTARDRRIDNPLYEEELNNLNYAITQLDNQPAADVQPVVHAKWIDNAHGSDFFGCSNCGFIYSYWDYDKYEYCPHCGAKMDEEVDGKCNI